MRRRPPKPARASRHRSDPKAEIVQLRRELEGTVQVAEVLDRYPVALLLKA